MTFYVISTTNGDNGKEAYRDRQHAERRFEAIASTGQFARLVAVTGEESVELNRARNGTIAQPKPDERCLAVV